MRTPCLDVADNDSHVKRVPFHQTSDTHSTLGRVSLLAKTPGRGSVLKRYCLENYVTVLTLTVSLLLFRRYLLKVFKTIIRRYPIVGSARAEISCFQARTGTADLMVLAAAPLLCTEATYISMVFSSAGRGHS